MSDEQAVDAVQEELTKMRADLVSFDAALSRLAADRDRFQTRIRQLQDRTNFLRTMRPPDEPKAT